MYLFMKYEYKQHPHVNLYVLDLGETYDDNVKVYTFIDGCLIPFTKCRDNPNIDNEIERLICINCHKCIIREIDKEIERTQGWYDEIWVYVREQFQVYNYNNARLRRREYYCNFEFGVVLDDF